MIEIIKIMKKNFVEKTVNYIKTLSNDQLLDLIDGIGAFKLNGRGSWLQHEGG